MMILAGRRPSTTLAVHRCLASVVRTVETRAPQLFVCGARVLCALTNAGQYFGSTRVSAQMCQLISRPAAAAYCDSYSARVTRARTPVRNKRRSAAADVADSNCARLELAAAWLACDRFIRRARARPMRAFTMISCALLLLSDRQQRRRRLHSTNGQQIDLHACKRRCTQVNAGKRKNI